MGKYTKIKSADIKPGDIIKFEFGDYGNWVTARIDEVHIDPNSNSNSNSNPEETYYPQKLIWHYLSDEPKEEEAQESKPQRDCRAEKLGNNPYRQFTCYSNLNDIVEKLN